jgi:hypothetical protein
MQRDNWLITNSDNEVLVNLPAGKISKQGIRVPIKEQHSVSCIFYATRRIAFFNAPDVNNSNLYKAYRCLKNEMINFTGDFEALLITLNQLCIELNIDPNSEIKTSEYYSETDKKFNKTQCAILHNALIKQKLFPLFNIQESEWHPRKGVTGLKESLREHGAHVFIGKFGFIFHVGEDKVIDYSAENTHNREVYAFKKGSYAGDEDQYTWTHSVVVDQVKNVNGIEMVFFRDPYCDSHGYQYEKIYALSYNSFIQRLTNQHSQRFALSECQNDNGFGIVSSNPNNLLKY